MEDTQDTPVYDRPAFGLDLDVLRAANIERLQEYKGGDEWELSHWSNATLGELGEAANIIKKIHRGDFTLDSARPLLAKEFADVLCYLDLMAYKAGIDLSKATVDKFNEISDRIGSPVLLSYDHWVTQIPATFEEA